MKRKLSSLALLIVLCLQNFTYADEKKTAKVADAPVILPDAPAPPTPVPPAVQKLSASQLYVIRASVECVVLTSPAGLVKVNTCATPITIRAQFTDGTGYETRTYSDKFLYTLEAAATGKCELLVIPAGAGANGILRRSLDVDAGTPPAPPTPVPPVPPVPPAPTDPLTKALMAAWAQETDANKASQAQLLMALYSTGATSTVSDQTLTTLGDLYAEMSKAGAILLPASALPKVRGALATYLAGVLGTSTTAPLDDATRAKAAATFTAISKALGGLK